MPLLPGFTDTVRKAVDELGIEVVAKAIDIPPSTIRRYLREIAMPGPRVQRVIIDTLIKKLEDFEDVKQVFVRLGFPQEVFDEAIIAYKKGLFDVEPSDDFVEKVLMYLRTPFKGRIIHFKRSGKLSDGYGIGQRPPELAEDGSFMAVSGIRVHAILDDAGRVLIVDKKTGLLIEDDCGGYF